MIRTYQKTSEEKPKPECRNLGIMVVCGNCSAIRTFKIDSALELLKNRYSAGFTIETECEVCGHFIEVTIVWIDATKPGYTYRNLPFPATEQVVTVSDENGLKNPRTLSEGRRGK